MISILDLQSLTDNWDGNDALAPVETTLKNTEKLLKLLLDFNIIPHHITPGPNGEVMVDVRSDDKSLEILFYPDVSKFVKFSTQEPPEQGIFHFELLSGLVGWLSE